MTQPQPSRQDPALVLRQAGVSVTKGSYSEPALPVTMGTVGSDSKFQNCASPLPQLLGLPITDCQVSPLRFCCHTMPMYMYVRFQ